MKHIVWLKNCMARKISHWQSGFPFYWDTQYYLHYLCCHIWLLVAYIMMLIPIIFLFLYNILSERAQWLPTSSHVGGQTPDTVWIRHWKRGDCYILFLSNILSEREKASVASYKQSRRKTHLDKHQKPCGSDTESHNAIYYYYYYHGLVHRFAIVCSPTWRHMETLWGLSPPYRQKVR